MSNSGEDVDALCVDQWKGQLDLDRPCGAVGSEARCWLCDDLTAWNGVMHSLGLRLADTGRGILLLESVFNAEGDAHQVTAVREASVLASWLLCHHPCIQELRVACLTGANSPADDQPRFPVRLQPSRSTPGGRRLRALYITRRARAQVDLRDLDTIVGLEMLHVATDDMGPYFADQIDALMEKNRATLKRVDICDNQQNRNGLRAIERLVACEFLRLEAPFVATETPDMDAMVRLMGVSTALKEIIAHPIVQPKVPVIARALAANRTLTKLSLCVEACTSLEDLFRALVLNDSLEELSLDGRVHVNRRCTAAVVSALEHNRRLQTLYIDALILHEGEGLGQWSTALSKNSTLQILYVYCQYIPMSEISSLCKALRVNKSLKALELPGTNGTDEERKFLARQLVEDECYDRVHVGPWTEPSVGVLLQAVASSKTVAKGLWLPDIGQLSRDNVGVLFVALASNKVSRLSLAVKHAPDDRVTRLCEILKNNRSIEQLQIELENGDSAKDILRALAVNAGISDLDLTFPISADEGTLTAFSGMLSCNNTITDISASLYAGPDRFLEAFAQGMSGNRIIVNCKCTVPNGTQVPPALWVPVQRNREALSHAVDFVLKRQEDKHSAECFEIFAGRSCLTTSLTEITGMSDVEARFDVAAAENRRRERYPVLTAVVRRRVVCWPADVTQIDELNLECWCAIARYLSVADVRFEQS